MGKKVAIKNTVVRQVSLRKGHLSKNLKKMREIAM